MYHFVKFNNTWYLKPEKLEDVIDHFKKFCGREFKEGFEDFCNNSEIRTSNDHFQEIDKEKEEKILKLQEDLLKKEKDLSIIKSYVCSHLGCGSRCPLREQAET